MIQITIYRDQTGQVVGFDSMGHAEYSEHGTDIVCAGVSAVTIGTANAIEQLCGVKTQDTTKMESGLLTFSLPDSLDVRTKERTSLILEAMVVSLQSIANSYGNFVNIQEKTRRCN